MYICTEIRATILCREDTPNPFDGKRENRGGEKRGEMLKKIKGTVPPDFSPLFYFFKQLLLAPVGKPSDEFDYFRIFAEIFDFSGASSMSLTPAKQMILL